jgi:hypothetical protein
MISWIKKLIETRHNKIAYRKRIIKFFDEKYRGVYDVMDKSNHATSYYITFEYLSEKVIQANVLTAHPLYQYQKLDITKTFGEKAKYYGFDEMYFHFMLHGSNVAYRYKNGKIIEVDNSPD